MNKSLVLIILSFLCKYAGVQKVTLTSDQLTALTPDWKGERWSSFNRR